MLITGAILTIFTLFLSFLAYDLYVGMQHYHIKEDFTRFHTIVGSLFPSVVLDRVVHEAVAFNEKTAKESPAAYDTSNNNKIVSDKNMYLVDCRVPVDTLGFITDKPIYNSFPQTTVCFMDIAGFSSCK